MERIFFQNRVKKSVLERNGAHFMPKQGKKVDFGRKSGVIFRLTPHF